MPERDFPIEIINRWDENALKVLYSHFYKALALFAYRMLSDHSSAEDAVQEVFFKLWQRKPIFDGFSGIRLWLYGSVRNQCIDYIRGRRMIVDLEERKKVEAWSQSEAEDNFYDQEIIRLLFQHVDRLPEGQRKVFLGLMEGKRMTEIAKELGLSVSTVKTHRQRGLDTLKKNLPPDAFLLAATFIGLS